MVHLEHLIRSSILVGSDPTRKHQLAERLAPHTHNPEDEADERENNGEDADPDWAGAAVRSHCTIPPGLFDFRRCSARSWRAFQTPTPTKACNASPARSTKAKTQTAMTGTGAVYPGFPGANLASCCYFFVSSSRASSSPATMPPA